MRTSEGICRCNGCGKVLSHQEDFFHGEKNWGYFSQKDGENHVFDLCENCYTRMIATFSLAPVEPADFDCENTHCEK